VLDDPDDVTVRRFFEKFRYSVGEVPGAQIAREVAARMSRYRENKCYEYALWVLTACRPADHVALFREAAARADRPLIASWGIQGIYAARLPGAPSDLLEIIGLTDDFGLALEAIADLIKLDEAGAVAQGTAMVFDVIERDAYMEEASTGFEHICSQFAEFGMEYSQFLSMRRRMLGEPVSRLESPDEPHDLFDLLLPCEEPGAASRAAAVLTPRRQRRLRRLLRGQRLDKLIPFTVNLVLEAIELANADNPAFKQIGTGIAAFVRAVAESPRLWELPPAIGRSFVHVMGVFLAKAIRGRYPAEELRRRGSDPDLLRTLLRLDEPWLTPAAMERIAATIPEEALLPLTESPDRWVRNNARQLLVAMNPLGHLAGNAARALQEDRDKIWRLSDAVPVAGDAWLDSWLDMPTENWHEDLLSVLGGALRTLETKRARFYLEHFFDVFSLHMPALPFLRAVGDLLSRDLVGRALECLREGQLNLGTERTLSWDLDELVWVVRTMLEVHGLEEDARAMVEEGASAYIEKHPRLRAKVQESEVYVENRNTQGLVEDGHDIGEEPEAHLQGILDPGNEQHAMTIQRVQRKVGRNELCPCGSRRKFKKCCG
jgi:hypothetical protein